MPCAMKQIAILEWGPLSMCQRSPRERLQIATKFMPGGPFLPAFPYEDPTPPGTVYQCSVRYAISPYKKLDPAIRNLRLSFGYGFAEAIGYINMRARKHRCCSEHKQFLQRIEAWAIMKNIDAVIWIDYESLASRLRMGKLPSALESMQKLVRDTFDAACNWRPPLVPEKVRQKRLKQQYVTDMTSWSATPNDHPPAMPWLKTEILWLQQMATRDLVPKCPQNDAAGAGDSKRDTPSSPSPPPSKAVAVDNGPFTDRSHRVSPERRNILRTYTPLARQTRAAKEGRNPAAFSRGGSPRHTTSAPVGTSIFGNSDSGDLRQESMQQSSSGNKQAAEIRREQPSTYAPELCKTPVDHAEDVPVANRDQGGSSKISDAFNAPGARSQTKTSGSVRPSETHCRTGHRNDAGQPHHDDGWNVLTLLDKDELGRANRFFSEPVRGIVSSLVGTDKRSHGGFDVETLKKQIQPEVVSVAEFSQPHCH